MSIVDKTRNLIAINWKEIQMTLHKRTFKQFVATMTVIILMLLGVSTVFAATGESMMASDAPIYSDQEPTSWFSYTQTGNRNARFDPFEIELILSKVGSVIPFRGSRNGQGFGDMYPTFYGKRIWRIGKTTRTSQGEGVFLFILQV